MTTSTNGSAPGFQSPTGTSPFSGPVPGGNQKTFAQILGEIVWLMSQSPSHKTSFIADLEWPVANAARQGA